MNITKNKKTLHSNALVFVVVIFGGVSATTMILFCISLTEDPTGQVLAGATGLGMVAAQYAFVYRINDSDEFNITGWVIVICLFTASVTGTYSWIESEFKTGTANNTKQSDSYKDYSELIAMKKATIKESLEQARADRTNEKGNYNGRAISTTSDAEKGQQELKELIDARGKLEGNSALKSSQALAADLGAYRFLAWLFWALIVDVCPLYAIHQLTKSYSATESDTLKSSDTKESRDTIENRIREKIKSVTKEKQPSLDSVIDRTKIPRNYLDQYEQVRIAIKNDEIKPGKNAVRVHFGLGTATVDKVFNQLIEDKVIQRSQNNRTYELVENETTENKSMARTT